MKMKNAKDFITDFFKSKHSDIDYSYANSLMTKTQVEELMEEYSKVQNQELINFLLEIEAWLTFNQTPDVKNTTALRDDIKILIGKYEN